MANLGGMTAAADSRSPALGGHARRVRDLCAWVSPLAARPRPRGCRRACQLLLVRRILSIFSVGVRPILFGLAFAEMAPAFYAAAGALGGRRPRTVRRFCGGRRAPSPWRLRPVQAMGIATAVERLGGIAPSPGPMFRLGNRRRDRRRDRLPDLARRGDDRSRRRGRPADSVRRAVRGAFAL